LPSPRTLHSHKHDYVLYNTTAPPFLTSFILPFFVIVIGALVCVSGTDVERMGRSEAEEKAIAREAAIAEENALSHLPASAIPSPRRPITPAPPKIRPLAPLPTLLSSSKEDEEADDNDDGNDGLGDLNTSGVSRTSRTSVSLAVAPPPPSLGPTPAPG